MPEQTKKKTKLLDLEISISRINLTQKALFARHLAVMLKAGLTITEALNITQDSTQGRFRKVVRGVLKSVQSGHSLSTSFSRYPKVFSGLFISATQAGETSGTLEGSLHNIAKQLEKEKELVSKIKGAMLYPVVVLIAAILLGLAMAFLILPKITPLFEGLKIDLPITTRALIWLSHLIQNHGLFLFLGFIALAIFIFWLVRQKFIKPVTHWFFLKTPIIKNISRDANLARFCRTLGTLLQSGLNIDEALEVTKNTLSNYYYRKFLTQVSQRISKGTKLSEDLKQSDKLFPIMVTRMISVGEESGKLEETLQYLANFYELEVNNATKSLSTAIEPALLIIIGLVVGFLALSIITPIYNISGGIKR